MDVAPCDLAVPSVLARVHALQRAAYRVEAELIDCGQMPGLTESPDELAASRETFFAAFPPGSARVAADIAGIIAIEFEPAVEDESAKWLRISRLAVDPPHARRGVGAALVRFVLARHRGNVVVSTGAANTPATRLYERMGFVKTRAFFTPDGRTPLVEYRVHRAGLLGAPC